MDENKVVEVGQEDVIRVEEGYKLIPIMNEINEQIGVFRFNPTDINIINRYNEIAPKFQEAIAPLAEAGVNEKGEGVDEDSIKILNEAEEKIIEMMDYFTNSDSRSAFFGRTHVFTPVNGNFYCGNVLNSIGQYIAKKFDKEVDAVNARMAKHTHGYRTGKHKKGDR